MEIIINFVVEHYGWFITGGGIAILALIGYFAEKNNLLKNENPKLVKKDSANLKTTEELPIKDNNQNAKFVEKNDDLVGKVETAEESMVSEFIEESNTNEIDNNKNDNLIPKTDEIIKTKNADNDELNNNHGLLQEENRMVTNNNYEKEKTEKSTNDMINIDNNLSVTETEKIIKSKNMDSDELSNNNHILPQKEKMIDAKDNNESNVMKQQLQNDISPTTDENKIIEYVSPETLEQTRNLDDIKNELNKIIFETNIDEKHLKNIDDKDGFNDIDIKLPDIESLRLERNKKNIDDKDVWNF
ncbi:MAG: hypothetical protein RR847_02965 [Bacilli bacterium]